MNKWSSPIFDKTRLTTLDLLLIGLFVFLRKGLCLSLLCFFCCYFVVQGENKCTNSQTKYVYFFLMSAFRKTKRKKINNAFTYSCSFRNYFVFNLGCSRQFQLELVLVLFSQLLTLRPVCDWASSTLIDLICMHNFDGIIHCKVHLWALQ